MDRLAPWCLTDSPVLLAYLAAFALCSVLAAWLYWCEVDEAVQDWYWDHDWESWDWE